MESKQSEQSLESDSISGRDGRLTEQATNRAKFSFLGSLQIISPLKRSLEPGHWSPHSLRADQHNGPIINRHKLPMNRPLLNTDIAHHKYLTALNFTGLHCTVLHTSLLSTLALGLYGQGSAALYSEGQHSL